MEEVLAPEIRCLGRLKLRQTRGSDVSKRCTAMFAFEVLGGVWLD